MEEDREKKEFTDEEDPIHRISLKRHLWPEEVELRDTKKKVSRLQKWCIALTAAGLALGWAAGSFLPLPGSAGIRDGLRSVFGLGSSSQKISAVKDIMANDWYFSKDIDHLEDRLTDQALLGMTTNPEDPHTAYMSKEETEAFVQSINRDYVGIGSEFIMYDDRPMLTRVFDGSPAEKAGLLAGDVLLTVNDTDTAGKKSEEIRDLILGEEGTDVKLTVMRNGSEKEITAIRGAVTATAYAKMLDSDLMYMQLYQFGDDTADKMKSYFDEMIAKGGNMKLILDLRGNGGGYLNSVQQTASFFLDKGDTVLQQEFTDGHTTTITAAEGKIDEIHDIVILVDGGTASAAEVMTLALKQNRDDVTIVGTTTYGKGTAQISASFKDGSTLKYTSSRWLSPKGDWINEKGIEPDVVCEQPKVLATPFPIMEDGVSYQYDDVAAPIQAMQYILSYFEMRPDREDGYFSLDTKEKWTAFEKEHDMQADGVMTEKEYTSAISEVIRDSHTSDTKDAQLTKAKEILHG